MSEFTVSGVLGIVVAGSNAVVLDIDRGEIAAVLDIGVDIVDLGDTDVNGTAYVLTEDKLFPIDLSGYVTGEAIEVGSDIRYLSVSEQTNSAVIAGEEALYTVDLNSYQVTEITDTLFRECRGMIVSDNILVVADGERSAFVSFEMETWTELGNYSVPGDVIDIFPGYNGYIAAIVENSNEIWFIDPDGCTLEKMSTFPTDPVAAASMPDGEFAFGSCDGVGFVVVSKSGELVYTSGTFGVPEHIRINRDGTRAIVCSQENEAVYILK